jgi:hypothetical protein
VIASSMPVNTARSKKLYVCGGVTCRLRSVPEFANVVSNRAQRSVDEKPAIDQRTLVQAGFES